MSTDPKKVMKNLKEDIEEDLDSLTDYFLQQLKAHTPVQSGRAKRGWRKANSPDISKGKEALVVNRVPYIGELDAGKSRQAPNGIVAPAMKKALKKYTK